MQNADLYRTTDLYQAAYLSTAGHRLSRTERAGSRCVFCFEASGIQASLVAWAGGTATTNAVSYADAVKRVKALLFA